MNDVRTCECNWSVYQTCDKCNPDELATLRAALEEAKRERDTAKIALKMLALSESAAVHRQMAADSEAQDMAQRLESAEAALQSAEAKGYARGVESTLKAMVDEDFIEAEDAYHFERLLLPRPDAEGEM
jgi:hypothetical protein